MAAPPLPSTWPHLHGPRLRQRYQLDLPSHPNFPRLTGFCLLRSRPQRLANPTASGPSSPASISWSNTTSLSSPWSSIHGQILSQLGHCAQRGPHVQVCEGGYIFKSSFFSTSAPALSLERPYGCGIAERGSGGWGGEDIDC
ncbi:Hypothetical predicted protein [Prunus dulcis]|uniref:Uncharacterized protein n=1 Tax=Prunus dulcis TaxID=3755 RepID=A0A5E4FRK0_PRUDU|nr:Hypothetical predicted protein [Prunus dulcis]